MLHRLAALALVAALAATPAASSAPLRAPSAGHATVVLVARHAEKASAPAADPPLTEDGARRAEALARVARDAHVTGIITTQFARTKLTAAPTAAALGLTPMTVAAGALAAHARATADSIRQHFSGGTVLVVGHSNTIPAIISALGGRKLADLCDAEYDALFVVVLDDDAPARVIRSRYGAPSDVSSCATMR